MRQALWVAAALASCLVSDGAAGAAADATGAENALARDILRELIEINTTDASGDNTRAAQAMAARLRAAGFPAEDVQVLEPAPRQGNLVARLRGTGAGRPLLLLAHLDVVEARREDWSVDPFVFLEKEGYYWGRGTADDKAMAAIFVANLIRYRREGFRPERDLIVALTADEEGGEHNGVAWLLKAHPSLIQAEYGLNEGGRGLMREGRYLANQVQASEKVYVSFRLEVTSPGGHSSLPVRDNAIYRLAEGLTRLAGFDFPVELSDITRSYFDRMSNVETGPVAADMKAVAAARAPDAEAVGRLSRSAFYNSMMRTTCVATRLEAGHADNALPQAARALVNCRVLPGVPAEDVRDTLIRVLDDPRISLSQVGNFKPSPPSPLRADVLRTIEHVTGQVWPGVAVVPIMGTGATDSLYLRGAGTPMYGVSGLFGDIDHVRAHGRDERIGIRQFNEGREFLYRLVKELSSPAR